jgi:hypothetical protein
MADGSRQTAALNVALIRVPCVARVEGRDWLTRQGWLDA